MIFPNKVVNIEDCVLSKIICILKVLIIQPISTYELYTKVKKNFDDLDQFILALDVLFVLEKVKLDEEWEVLTYVKEGNM